MWVCLFSIEIQMAGQITIKFGTVVVLDGGRFLGGFQYPHPGYGVRKGGLGCGNRSPFRAPNPDLEGPGPHPLLSRGPSL